MRNRKPPPRHDGPGRHGPGRVGHLRVIVGVMVLPVLGLLSIPFATGAGAAAAATKLVITSDAFTAAASTSPTARFTITLEGASGTATTDTSALKIYLAGSSNGRLFSATSGGTPVSLVTLPAGTKSIKAYYGDANAGTPTITVSLTSPPSSAGLTEGSQTETITAAATKTTLAASPSPGAYGAPETLTASVTSKNGTPVGSVTFLNGTTALCTAVPLSAGTATCIASSLAPTKYSLSADFTTSSIDDADSTSAAVSLKVDAGPTTTTLTSSADPSSFGTPVVVTAAVAGPAGTPTGTVTFSLGTTVVCRKVTLTTGAAQCTYATLAVGTDSLTAVFTSSSVDYAGSTSAALIQTVSAWDTTTTLSSGDGGLSTWPSSPVETARVNAASGPQPSGTVAFFANGTPVASCAAVAFTPSAPAQCTLVGLDAGTYAITATATPSSSSDSASTSASLAEVVQPAATSTTLGAVSATATYGSPVTLTADESPAPGTVTFLDGSTVLCAAVAVSDASASCTTSALPVGADSLTAVFTSSSVDYAGSSGTLTMPITPGAPVALVITSAAINAPAGTSPIGAVTITLEDAYGNATTSPTPFRVFLSGSSTGRRFSATPGGALINSITLPANTQSVTVYYADSSVGTPTITVSLTSPPSNAGLLKGSQVETITAAA